MDPKILIVGCESTGERFGAALTNHLKGKAPDAVIRGIGGSRMEAAGVDLIYNVTELDSLGVFDNFKGGHITKRLLSRVSQEMDYQRPDIVVQVGLPSFNLKLLELAQCKDIPVVYYYTPFSWGDTRIKLEELASFVRKVAGVTKNEVELLEKVSIDVEFVGHPILDVLPKPLDKITVRKGFELTEDDTVVALLPGSREVDVRVRLPVMIKGMELVAKENPEIKIVVAGALSSQELDLIQKSISKSNLDIQVIEKTYDALNVADLAVVTCGTASLEAALYRIPFIAVDKPLMVSFLSAKRLGRKGYSSLPNAIMQQKIVPELVQNDFNERLLAEMVIDLLNSSEKRKSMLSQFDKLRDELGEPGSLARTADMILDILQK
ncbi:MAG: lipid-A-disaccharide synthase [Firmicutes bacterium]|nr:lipid-A-disaccharide synthase [Bacillota bacterium]